MERTDGELLELAVAASFTHDAHGRIGYDNEPEGDRAPRFFLARSAAGNLWRMRDDLRDEAVRQLDALAAAEPVTADLRAPPHQLDAYLTVLRASHEIAAVEFGPAYRFPDDLPTPGTTTTITRANLELLRHMVGDLADVARDFETGQPTMVVVVEGYAARYALARA